jgi:tetratricopeptide (TPR) repeat protein
VGAALTAMPAAAADLDSMWDFGRPELSEQRFRAALQRASGDEALILQTQVARTYGLRGDFERARAVLKAVEPSIEAAGPQARARYALELGRTYASAAHPPESQTPEARALARAQFAKAEAIARAARLDALAIDALHMQAFVDTAPAEQLKWAQAALQVLAASSQPDARRWEASLRNNLGYALHQLGRYDEALTQFRRALALRERGTDARATRAARWMVAWTLRALGRTDEALAIQLRLAQEGDAAGQPDPYVFDELQTLYRERGDAARADFYASRRKAAGP